MTHVRRRKSHFLSPKRVEQRIFFDIIGLRHENRLRPYQIETHSFAAIR